jgi:hypothetical protein
MNDDALVELWMEALRHAYQFARSERLLELRDKRPRLLDDRGLHPYSLEVGRIMALRELEPALAEVQFDPIELRRLARQDAAKQFADEVFEERLRHEGTGTDF